MTKKHSLIALAIAAACLLGAQQSDILIKIMKGERARLAVPDFRGSADAQAHMNVFNQTLWNDLQNAGLFDMVPKSMYPLEVPQRPQDFRPPLAPSGAPRRGAPPPKPVRQGPWLEDWSGPPVSANYLAFGYAGVQGDQLVLFGWLYNAGQRDLANAHVFGKTYFGSLDEAGARKVAHDFAADILRQFGGESLAGSKIYFVSERASHKEIWVMDHDGGNQKQITRHNSTSLTPAVSADGAKLAYTTYARGNPAIFIQSLETGRRLPFYNQPAPMVATPDFTPDSRQIVFSSSASGWAQIYISNVDGSNMQRLTSSRAIEVAPRVNPKTGAEIVFVSGRSGLPQIYKMNIDGANVERLTNGEGEAVSPAWSPDGQHIVFAWTRGFAPGNYNVFIMNVATREFVQLTHGAGRNENPGWAPDGRHIVFSSTRSGSSQIWTMLADGTRPQQLTTQGRNTLPIWAKQ